MCNCILGYKETVSVWDDVMVMTSVGTAAYIKPGVCFCYLVWWWVENKCKWMLICECVLRYAIVFRVLRCLEMVS